MIKIYETDKLGTMTDAEYIDYDNERQKLLNNAIKYDDFNVMMRDMKEHVESTGHTIVQCDVPERLQIGYIDATDQSKWFVMRIAAVKTWRDKIKDAEPEKVELIKRAMSSENGKIELLKIINGE